MTAVWLILIALAASGSWYVERRLHPYRRCPRCGGDRKNIGSNRDRWGICGRCGGKGEVPRWGAGKGD